MYFRLFRRLAIGSPRGVHSRQQGRTEAKIPMQDTLKDGPTGRVCGVQQASETPELRFPRHGSPRPNDWPEPPRRPPDTCAETFLERRRSWSSRHPWLVTARLRSQTRAFAMPTSTKSHIWSAAGASLELPAVEAGERGWFEADAPRNFQHSSWERSGLNHRTTAARRRRRRSGPPRRLRRRRVARWDDFNASLRR